MEQLIFVGVIVLFSILEAVARKRKAGGGEAGELPPPPPPPTPRRRETHAPSGRLPGAPGPTTYDEEPSYEENPVGAGGARGDGASPSSEGLIPADIWEEIAALARGEVPPSRSPAPQAPEGPAPAPRRPVPTARPVPAPAPAPAPTSRMPRTPTPSRGRGGDTRKVGRPEPRPPAPIRGRKAVTPAPALEPALEEIRDPHPLHATHRGLGEPLSDRLTTNESEARARGRAEMAEVRRLLRSGNTGSLRKAVILGEVLGPPQSMREGE